MPHNLQLDPSAAIPFTHDSPGARDSKLDELRSAVADSGAEHAYMVPPLHEDTYDGDWFNNEFLDETELETDNSNGKNYYEIPPSPTPPTFAHGIGSAAMKIEKTVSYKEQEAISSWIQ